MDNFRLILASLHACWCSQSNINTIINTYTSMSIIEKWNEWQTKWNFSLAGMSADKQSSIQKKIREFSPDTLEEIIHTKNISIITKEDPEYPDSLRHIGSSPYMLYIRGTLPGTQLPLGIVGSRSFTSYGKNVLECLFKELSAHNISIISGGAYGIDAIAHELALTHNMHTVAVFGCGIDLHYPTRNSTLFDNILEHGGALVSIFPIGTRAEPYMFPVRNEIVAGLSRGIIIPEAGEKSGTLITASLALEQWKDIFAVPGDIFKKSSRGCNLLIAKWEAKCILSATDILEEYLTNPHAPPILSEEKTFSTPLGKWLYEAIHAGHSTPEMLHEYLSESIDTIMMELAMLEIDGHISLGADGNYTCIYSSLR